MNRKYAGSSRDKVNMKNFKNSIKLFFLLVTVGASTLISTSAYAAGYDCYMVRPCWWHGETSTLTCGVVNTYCRYIPDFPLPAPPITPPPPPYIPPPVSTLTPVEKLGYCQSSPDEVGADKQSCDAAVDLVRASNQINCADGRGTIKWELSFSGVRFSTSFAQTSSYNDGAACRGMNISFSNYAKSQCATQETRARGDAVRNCGPIQW